MSLTLLKLLCLLQAWPSSSRFVFEFELTSIDTQGTIDNETCDPVFELPDVFTCEPLLQAFCLREGRSTQSNNTVDCPLGRNDTEIVAFILTDDNITRPGLPNGPVSRTVVSQTPWPGAFQLYVKAGEVDLVPTQCVSELRRSIAPLDDIFINMTLEVNADFTRRDRYWGTSTRNTVIVALDMRFRVMCQQDYYGADCTRFCRSQNDSLNGYYCTCNSDGSFRCREGFRNPSNNCTEGIRNTSTITEIPLERTGMIVTAVGAGVAVPLVVIILILIIIIIVLVHKRRAEKPYQMHQGHHRDTSANSAHQLEERFTPTTAIHATTPSRDSTIRRLENTVYGGISDNEDDEKSHDFQSPIYVEAEDDGAQQDEFYATPQVPQPVPLDMERGGPEYDYATNAGAGAVTVNIGTNGSTPASHKYTAFDESKRKEVVLNLMENYEKLQHVNKPPDFVRLSNVEGVEYDSL